jgi:hypothetical protein
MFSDVLDDRVNAHVVRFVGEGVRLMLIRCRIKSLDFFDKIPKQLEFSQHDAFRHSEHDNAIMRDPRFSFADGLHRRLGFGGRGGM